MTTRQPNYQNQRNSNFYTGYQARSKVNPNESLDLFASVDQSMISQTPKMNFDPNQSALNSFTVSPIRQPGNPAVWNQGHDDSMNTSMFNSPHFAPNGAQNGQRTSARSNFHRQHQQQQQRQQPQQQYGQHQQQQQRYGQNGNRSPVNPQGKNPQGGAHYNPESTYQNSGGDQGWKQVDNQPFEIMDLYSQDSQRSNEIETEAGGFYQGNHAGGGIQAQQNQFIKKPPQVGYGGQGGGGGTLGSRLKNYADLNGFGEEQTTPGGQNIQRSSEGFCGKDDCCLI